ncbi:hypothetical protein ACVD1N_07630 [Vibrio parahaemolyticus]|uniref:hypothetical protein n=1 Tax=Vibrio parahaemolyticus TaxID=670 RepID=UPI00226A146E|nr:hypothetical protein [Vibrio parahaemolyticus]EKH9200313.1 hypothetical protein [Vibrio parahaemolyticus]MCX8804465.1 hypothetical protein [Vibrio parahaemolyticus]
MININLPYLDNGIRSDKPENQITGSIKVSIDSLVNESENVASMLELQTFATPKGATEALIAASLHQKQIVAQMMSSNPEDAIALSLAASIEAYGKQLEIIQGWTEGGLEMFESAEALMFEAAKSAIDNGETSGFILEDLFVLAIIDFVAHGYSDDPEMTAMMMHFLESTGSGSHGVHEGWNGEKFAEAVLGTEDTVSLYQYMLDNSPPNSLCHEILTYMDENLGGRQALAEQYNKHYEDEIGYIGNSDYPDSSSLSPMLRLALMAEYLAMYPQTEQDVINLFLTGSIGEIDVFINENTDYDSAITFICENDGYEEDRGWRLLETSDGNYIIDWYGNGLNQQYFIDLYSNFPPRDLTEEEIEEVNRIGDQVKMLQQTLLYWLKICRDEQMAMAQNI